MACWAFGRPNPKSATWGIFLFVLMAATFQTWRETYHALRETQAATSRLSNERISALEEQLASVRERQPVQRRLSEQQRLGLMKELATVSPPSNVSIMWESVNFEAERYQEYFARLFRNLGWPYTVSMGIWGSDRGVTIVAKGSNLAAHTLHQALIKVGIATNLDARSASADALTPGEILLLVGVSDLKPPTPDQ